MDPRKEAVKHFGVSDLVTGVGFGHVLASISAGNPDRRIAYLAIRLATG